MAERLSVRLEALVRNACPGWHAAETIREAAELARRVEGADVAKGSMDFMPDNYRMLIIHMANGAVANPYRGKFFRLVPDTPTPPAPGHEREGGNGG